MYICISIERPLADAADPNPEHVKPPRPTPGGVGGISKPTRRSITCLGTLCPVDWGPGSLWRSQAVPRGLWSWVSLGWFVTGPGWALKNVDFEDPHGSRMVFISSTWGVQDPPGPRDSQDTRSRASGTRGLRQSLRCPVRRFAFFFASLSLRFTSLFESN